MMRRKLPNRREIITVAFEHASQRYVASAARFDDGELAELFLNTSGKSGSESDVNAADGAVAISLALQHGCKASVIRAALKRNPDGSPMGPLARALDLMAERT